MKAPDNRRILVVDDDPAVRSVHGRIVQLLGYDVEMASDGVEALTKLPLDVDLVLLDVDMPNMDGFEVVRRIRAQPEYKLLPIVMVTGLDESSSYVKAMEAGANDLIAKPIKTAELKLRSSWLLNLKDAYDRLRAANLELGDSVRTTQTHLRSALEELTEANRRVQAAHLDTIRRLTRAAEYKDELTVGHTDRVGMGCSAIARKLGWTPGEVDMIRHAAPMHDVGKIALPDEILLKPTDYDEVERAVMRKHTTIGAELLDGSDSEIIKMGARIALNHHEQWDGGGYPRGIETADIPIEARVCFVMDTFDAATMDRPHRPALNEDAALSLIESASGTRFDPKVVEAFFDALPEIREIRAEFPVP
jgi:putative two-component system response regulator